MINSQPVRLEGDMIITFDEFDRLIMENDKDFQKIIKIKSFIILDKDGKIVKEEPAKTIKNKRSVH